MGKELVKQEAESEVAFAIFQSLLEAKHEAGKQFLKIGESLTIINEKGWYKYFNVDSFEEFIAIPELGLARATARLFMHVYSLYIRKLGLSPDRIAEIKISGLQKIAPVVEENPEEWLSMADMLSNSDLDSAIREHRGLPPRTTKKEKMDEEINLVNSYKDFVKSHKCIVCDNPVVDAHHFPRTKGAGGSDRKVIPLCRDCHIAYHSDPHRFITTFEERIFDYFYGVIFEAYKIIKERQGEDT